MESFADSDEFLAEIIAVGEVCAEVDDGAASLFADGAHRGPQHGAGGFGGVVWGAIAEDVAQEIASVHADEDGLGVFDGASIGVEGADVADGEGEVWLWIDGGLEGEECEGAFVGLDCGAANGLDASDERFAGQSVFDDLRDGADLDVVLLGELFEIGHAGHVAVVAHDLDDDGGGVEPGESAEVDGSLGLPGADEDAAVTRAERVDVSGADEICGSGGLVDGEFDGSGAFVCGDAGGEAVAGMAVDGDGEGRSPHGGVDGRLGVEVESVAVAFAEGEAEVSAGDGEHEVDGLGRDMLSGEDEVALVLAIFIVDEDDHLAVADVVQDGGYG